MSLVDEEQLQRRPPQVVPPQMDLSELRQRSLEIITDSCGGTCHYSPAPLKSNNQSESRAFPTLLRLLLLAAAVIEVQVVGGDLQTTWNHRHDGDELAVFRQDQFFLLALVFSFPSERTKTDCFLFSLNINHSSETCRNSRLTCCPKRPGPLLLNGRPPCFSLSPL